MKKYIAPVIAFLGGLYFMPGLLGYGVYNNPGGNMTPTIDVGDYIVADKQAYSSTEPEINDLVIYANPRDLNSTWIGRVVALPSNKISIVNGITMVEGKEIVQDYINPGMNKSEMSVKLEEQTVPKSSVFIMGDNRDSSMDSRYFGPVPLNNLLGHIVIII